MDAEVAAPRPSRQSLDRLEHDNISMQRANTLAQEFRNIPLNLVQAEVEFQQRIQKFHEEDPTSTQSTPADIAGDTAHKIAFLRKLKFHYLEKYAKDKYVKIIMNDDADLITVDENEELRQQNEARKALLKQAKTELANRFQEMRDLSTQAGDEYNLAQSLTTEIGSLTQEILDARLAISRLRTLHPQPRLTVASADRTLSAQEKTMAQLDTELSEVTSQVEQLKDAVQSRAREVERLRVERAEKEKEAKECKVEEDDERVVALYDWFSASLALHKKIFGLQSTQCKSDNELELQYRIGPLKRSGTVTTPEMYTIVITLLFLPGTRQLGDAKLSILETPAPVIDIAELVAAYVQSNDVPGLLRSILAAVRRRIDS